jgi:protoporphyrinogen oxidase
MLWEACARKIRERGGTVLLDRRVSGCSYDAASQTWSVEATSHAGDVTVFRGSTVIYSAPLGELVRQLSPAPGDAALQASKALRYRDFLTVALVLRDVNSFSDNWIYVHDPKVMVGRIQNFKSWSPEMVPDPKLTCYGLEYFCFEGDKLWTSPDAELIALATAELAQVGLARAEDVVDAHVVRQRKAYPVYDADYRRHVNTIREELASRYPRLCVVGATECTSTTIRTTP